MDKYKSWASGMKGKVVFNEEENQYMLDKGWINFSLESPLWHDYEGKKVLIIIKVLNDKGGTK